MPLPASHRPDWRNPWSIPAASPERLPCSERAARAPATACSAFDSAVQSSVLMSIYHLLPASCQPPEHEPVARWWRGLMMLSSDALRTVSPMDVWLLELSGRHCVKCLSTSHRAAYAI